MTSNEFAVAVIGRGMIGSATARHLGETGVSTVLIGSGEPADYATSGGPFASHYDAGRITGLSNASATWSELSARSISRYGEIAERSGITFHDPRGLARVASHTQRSIDNALQRGGDARRVDRGWLRSATGIAVRDDHPGEILFEGPPAGVINPRSLVAAQNVLAKMAGATIIDAPATAVRSTPSGFEIEAGTTIGADQIILATGAYGASLVGVDLALERRLRTIVLAELGPGIEIPTFSDGDPAHPDLDEIYWVPPVRFPDGRVLLKIGGNSLPMITGENEQDIAAWFRSGGSAAEAAPLQETVRALLPDAVITAWDNKPCVVTYTQPELPYIGFVDDGVIVALGASGSGASSSDELGRLAASLAMPEGWTDQTLELTAFAPQLS